MNSLKEYVERNGFRHGDRWYFRTTWMPISVREQLEGQGIIRKVGSGLALREMGVDLPQNTNRYAKLVIFYETDAGQVK